MTNSSVETLLQQGREQRNRGQDQAALEIFQQAAKLEPQNPQVLYECGLTYHSLKQYPESVQYLDLALEIKPDYILALARRGMAYKSLNQNEQAKVDFEKAIEIEPQNDEDWRGKGIALRELGRYEESIASYDKAIEINPNDNYAWSNKGFLLNELKRYEEAIASYDKAIKINPNYGHAWNNKGFLLNKLKRYEDAIKCFDSAIEINPNDNYAWNTRGISLHNLRRYDEAIASFDKAIEINPNYGYAWNNKGFLLNELKQYEDAIKCFDRAREINLNDDYAWSNRGISLHDLRRYEEAIASYDKAIKINPNYDLAWNNRGISLRNLRRYEEAIASYQQATKIKPDYWKAWRNMGIAYYNLGWQKSNPFKYWFDAEASYKQALNHLEGKEFFQEYLEVLQKLIQVSQYLMSPYKVEELRRKGADILNERLQDQELSLGEKITLKRKFSAFNQEGVDILAQSTKTNQQIQALELAEQRKNTCISWLRQKTSSDAAYLPYSRMQELLKPETAAIFWHISPTAITTFIIKHQQPLKVLSPKSPPQQQQQLTLLNTPEPNLANAYQLRRFDEWLQKWKLNYQDYCQGKLSSKEEAPWRKSMEFMLKGKDKLSDILEINNINQYLRDVKQLILIPHRELHLLPLHYLFPDKFTITYLPSFQIGLDLQLTSPEAGKILSLEDSCNDLPFSKIESVAIPSLFPESHQLEIANTTKESLLTALKTNTGYFHFTGHGYHQPEHPRESALVLSETDKLTLGNIFDDESLHLSQYQLICLSACETGITSQEELLDEYVGLVSGFLAKQVSYVVSTLWRVDERSTALLMIEFYQQLLKQAKPPAEALKDAKNWLRNATYQDLAQWYRELASELKQKSPQCSAYLETEAMIEDDRAKIESSNPPYAHPYYWAGFIITGKTN